MAIRKSVDQRILEAQEKITQEQNKLKKLQDQQKEKERKARNHRLCKRHGLIESLLPATATLTDEQFQAFLNEHIANKDGRRMLDKFVANGADSTTPESAEPKQHSGATADTAESDGTAKAG